MLGWMDAKWDSFLAVMLIDYSCTMLGVCTLLKYIAVQLDVRSPVVKHDAVFSIDWVMKQQWQTDMANMTVIEAAEEQQYTDNHTLCTQYVHIPACPHPACTHLEHLPRFACRMPPPESLLIALHLHFT